MYNVCFWIIIILLLVYLLYLFNKNKEDLYVCSSGREDRFGAQLNWKILTYWDSYQKGHTYIGSLNEVRDPKMHNKLCELLGLPIQLPPNEHYKCKGDNGIVVNADYWDKVKFSDDFINLLRSRATYLPKRRDNKLHVVVHVRRGDNYPERKGNFYLTNKYYLDIIDIIKKYKPDSKITILTEPIYKEPIDVFKQYDLKIDHPILECYKLMMNCDILVTSKSAFSYVAALYNKNIVIHAPFFTPLPSWLNGKDKDFEYKLRLLVNNI